MTRDSMSGRSIKLWEGKEDPVFSTEIFSLENCCVSDTGVMNLRFIPWPLGGFVPLYLFPEKSNKFLTFIINNKVPEI